MNNGEPEFPLHREGERLVLYRDVCRGGGLRREDIGAPVSPHYVALCKQLACRTKGTEWKARETGTVVGSDSSIVMISSLIFIRAAVTAVVLHNFVELGEAADRVVDVVLAHGLSLGMLSPQTQKANSCLLHSTNSGPFSSRLPPQSLQLHP
jgi:hypothetical protein